MIRCNVVKWNLLKSSHKSFLSKSSRRSHKLATRVGLESESTTRVNNTGILDILFLNPGLYTDSNIRFEQPLCYAVSLHFHLFHVVCLRVLNLLLPYITPPGLFVMDHHTLPEYKSRIIPPSVLGVGFTLEQLWSEGTFDSPQQLWRATSAYNLKVRKFDCHWILFVENLYLFVDIDVYDYLAVNKGENLNI